jgi:hypothetical protein
VRYICGLFRPAGNLPRYSSGYSGLDVDRLYRGLSRNTDEEVELVVVTDYPDAEFDEPVVTAEFQNEERGWACLMELYRPDLVGDRAVVLGLDTIIVGNLAEVESQTADVVAPYDPYHKPELCNAIISLSGKASEELWDKWSSRRTKDLEDPRYRYIGGHFSEMVWLRQNITPDAWWSDATPGQIASYKVDLVGGELGERTRVVYFHGFPKPREVNYRKWVQENWR